jgi:hypothetical protein
LDWQSADKLKAVRLLGRHPIEAVDDRNVLMIFVACQAIESRDSIPIPEIWYELRAFERKAYAQRLIGRGIEKLRPKDAAAARQALYAIIDRAMAQIALKAETHRARTEINEALTGERLLFDDSPEAERLRRFDLACGRGLVRSLDSLLKLRRAPELVDCPLSLVNGPLSMVEGPPSAAGDTPESSAKTDATNELTSVREIVTNEPITARENAANEATAAAIKLECPGYTKALVQNVTNEAVGRENTTNEPTHAVVVECGPAEGSAGMNDRAENEFFDEVIDRQKSVEWNRAGLVRMVAISAEKLRELNDESRSEAKGSDAEFRSQAEWHENGGPADRLTTHAAGAKPRTMVTNASWTFGDSAELVKDG